MKDIEKSPVESFPSINLQLVAWLRICLFESKDRIILRTEPGSLQCMQNDTDLFGTRL